MPGTSPFSSATTPLSRYRDDLKRKGFCRDTAQEAVVFRTQRLYDDLLSSKVRYPGRLWKFFSRKRPTVVPVNGLYIWGGVGRGKTYLIDVFFDSLPFSEKLRIHFHRFMQSVHCELKSLGKEADPLGWVAERLSQRVRILCLDELHVGDITDAMLLGNLLAALFKRGVTLVATSNEAPDHLYRGGLQRERFLPAIDLIKRNMEVVHLDSETDYRLRALERAQIYHSPLDETVERSLRQCFEQISRGPGKWDTNLEINGRKISTVRCADGIVWFEFEELCGTARAAPDYIEIARCFNTVLIGNIPILNDMHDDHAKRLIILVDEFYDRNVKLIVSAAADPEHLYIGARLTHSFRRTSSRLHEMQSHDYLARQHLP